MTNPLFSIGKMALNLVLSKNDADATYSRLLPALRFIVEKKGRGSLEAKGLFDILEKLPSAGARRLNFKKEYIDKPNGWKSLPDDSSKLPFGFWH